MLKVFNYYAFTMDLTIQWIFAQKLLVLNGLIKCGFFFKLCQILLNEDHYYKSQQKSKELQPRLRKLKSLTNIFSMVLSLDHYITLQLIQNEGQHCFKGKMLTFGLTLVIQLCFIVSCYYNYLYYYFQLEVSIVYEGSLVDILEVICFILVVLYSIYS